MTSAIGSTTTTTRANWAPQRPDPAKLAADVLAKVDTKKQGYIDKDELQAALTSAGASQSTGSGATTTAAATADALFKKLDGDGDGKVTATELSDGIKKLSSELDSQFNSSKVEAGRAKGQGGGPPPGGPPGGAGKSEGSASATASSDASKVYDPADANQDGTVTIAEQIAYAASSAAKTETGSGNDSVSQTSQSQDAATSQVSEGNEARHHHHTRRAEEQNAQSQPTDGQASQTQRDADRISNILNRLAQSYGVVGQDAAQSDSSISVSA